MSFCFYPNHEYACPNVSHCPHLGGAGLGTLVVAADKQELYVVTRKDIIKLWDKGELAEHAWTAQLDVFPGHVNVNTLTPTITANGIAVAIGASRELGDDSLLMENGFGLLDRDTEQSSSAAPIMVSPRCSIAASSSASK